MVKKIGILTSGGDCGGLNAAIRSIFFRAKKKYKMEVFGIRNGTLGLINRPLEIEKLKIVDSNGLALDTRLISWDFNLFNAITFSIDKKNIKDQGSEVF